MLQEFRLSICRSLLDSALELQKYQKWLKQNGGDVDRTALMYFGILVDSLGLYYDTGDEVYRQIYIGEAYKTSHDPNLSRDEQQVVRERISAAIMTGVLDNCRRVLGPGSLDQLVSDLDGMHRAVVIPARKSADVLMVGDCLFLEVASFLCGPLLEEGTEFNPSFIGSHNPAELRNQIRERAQTSWAAVCYSPFTYTFSDHYAASLRQSTGFARPGAVRAMVEPAMEIIGGHLDLIASLFDCPVFVHNSVNVRRHDSTLVDVAKMILSWGTRRRVRDEANRQLADHVEKVNASTFPHVHVFDEHEFLGKHSEWELGRRYYNSRVQHPTVLSRLIADRYRDLIETLLNFSTKKLVICDLDNTLWEGEIGEGDVRHYQDRQLILRRLREKGVLLAINSRNDARNVHWRGAALDASDFVASEINWDTKPNNMKRIQQKLNLKTKDFVFIDDRGDQREFVSSAFPEIRVLDATADRSWQLLDHWSHLIFRNDEGDRTRQYREREQREQFLTRQPDEVDPAKVMANLGLRHTSTGR